MGSHFRRRCTAFGGESPATTRSGRTCEYSFWLDAEVAGDALPPPIEVHPGIGEAAAPLPGHALIDSLLVVGACHYRGVSVVVNRHACGPQRLRAVDLSATEAIICALL